MKFDGTRVCLCPSQTPTCPVRLLPCPPPPHLHHPHARYPIELGERGCKGQTRSPLAPFIPGRRNRFTSFSPPPKSLMARVCVHAASECVTKQMAIFFG